MRKSRLLAVMAGLALTVVGPTLSASAHSGGKAQLYMRKITATPSATDGNYDLTIELIDADSGEAMSGYAVSVEGRSGDGQTIAPTPTTAVNGGRYTASVPASAGDWTLTIRGNGAPGVGEAVPLAYSQAISFTDSTTSAGPGGSGGDDGGGGGAAGLIVAIVAVLALGGVGAAFLMKRRASSLAGATN